MVNAYLNDANNHWAKVFCKMQGIISEEKCTKCANRDSLRAQDNDIDCTMASTSKIYLQIFKMKIMMSLSFLNFLLQIYTKNLL